MSADPNLSHACACTWCENSTCEVWCFTSFGGVVVVVFSDSFCVLMPSFSSFGWGLRFSSLRLGGAAWFPPPLGSVAFPVSFQVVLPSFHFFGRGYVPLLFCWVVLLGLLLLWVVLRFSSPLAWSCLPSPPLGVGCVPTPSSDEWCCLVSYFGRGGVAVSPLLLRGVAFLSLFWVVVLFSSLRLGGVAWSPLGGASFFLASSVGWCCVATLFLRGVAFLSLLWAVALGLLLLLGLLLSVGWYCCPKSKRKDAK